MESCSTGTESLPLTVRQHSPEQEPEAARALITTAIEAALESLVEQRRVAVARAAETLDAFTSVTLLSAAASHDGLRPVVPKTMADYASHYSRARPFERLLEIGALRPEWSKVDSAAPLNNEDPIALLARYQVTPFGHAIARRVADSMMGHLPAEQIEGLKEFGSRGKS